jgi:hypothetical protein
VPEAIDQALLALTGAQDAHIGMAPVVAAQGGEGPELGGPVGGVGVQGAGAVPERRVDDRGGEVSRGPRLNRTCAK